MHICRLLNTLDPFSGLEVEYEGGSWLRDCTFCTDNAPAHVAAYRTAELARSTTVRWGCREGCQDGAASHPCRCKHSARVTRLQEASMYFETASMESSHLAVWKAI